MAHEEIRESCSSGSFSGKSVRKIPRDGYDESRFETARRHVRVTPARLLPRCDEPLAAASGESCADSVATDGMCAGKPP